MNKLQDARREHFGRQLHELNQYFKALSLEYIHKNGFKGLTLGQLNLLIQLDLTKPTPTSLIIENLGISKQAISRMLNLCETELLIERVPSEKDSRSQDIILLERGHEIIKVGLRAVKYAEKQISKVLGHNEFMDLKNKLISVTNKLEL